MNADLKGNITNILESLEVPFSYNEDTEIFTLMIKNESSAYYVALWYREGINALNFSAPLTKTLSRDQLNDFAIDLLIENDTLAFGNIGIFHIEKKDVYAVVYNITITLERGSGIHIISEVEINEYISYMMFLFPGLTQKIGESVGIQYSV